MTTITRNVYQLSRNKGCVSKNPPYHHPEGASVVPSPLTTTIPIHAPNAEMKPSVSIIANLLATQPCAALPGPSFVRRAMDLSDGDFSNGQPSDGQGRGAPILGKHQAPAPPNVFHA